MRVAPIEWLNPGACPPAAGDLLDTMFHLFRRRTFAGTFPTRE
jgi:hypothetical protein